MCIYIYIYIYIYGHCGPCAAAPSRTPRLRRHPLPSFVRVRVRGRAYASALQVCTRANRECLRRCSHTHACLSNPPLSISQHSNICLYAGLHVKLPCKRHQNPMPRSNHFVGHMRWTLPPQKCLVRSLCAKPSRESLGSEAELSSCGAPRKRTLDLRPRRCARAGPTPLRSASVGLESPGASIR